MKSIFGKIHALLVVLLLMVCSTMAQSQNAHKEMVVPPFPVFQPNWQIGVQGGAAVDVGEASLGKLISPAVQLSGTYQFTEIFGARLSVSGLWARNRYTYPLNDYKWNFVQPTLELKVDLASLIMGWVLDQPVSAYAVAGLGAAYSFHNNDAVEASERNGGMIFQKLWKNHRWNPVVRLGLGADVRLNDVLSVSAEANANMLPDHFNSKTGKKNNRDWHFNALVGLKVNLGRNYKIRDAVYKQVRSTVIQPAQKVLDKQRDTVAMVVNIQYQLNSSNLRSSEFGKLIRLADYLKQHPRSHVEMTGYADRMTGTAQINDRLSRERAIAVSNYLQQQGISNDRIYKDAKGDRVQPFPVNEDNRVTICYVVDMLE